MIENLPLSIAIDPRKNRIRVHKATLHALGDPKWIQLLFNPEDQVLAIRAATRKLPGGHEIRIRPREICGQEFELYSSLLFYQMSHSCVRMEKGYTYKLTGEYKAAKKTVFFRFSTMVCNENE